MTAQLTPRRTRPSRPAPIPTVGLATRGRARKQDHPLWFLVPALAVLVVFFFVPTLFNFVYAFTNWSSFHSDIAFVGGDNFAALFQNGTLLADLRTTLIYAVLVAVFQNLFGLVLALVLEADTRINRIARTAFFVPVVMSALAVGYIFQALLKPAGGLKTAKDALAWLTLMKEELGRDWLEPDLFRIGASSMLGDIERQLEHHITGRYAAQRHFAMA